MERRLAAAMANFFSTSTKVAVWCLILMSFSAVTIRVHSQLDSLGFISIDCGHPDYSSYIDSTTKMPYNSDTQFIDTGTNYRIATLYIKPSLDKQLLSLTSFPNGTRNCYTLKSLDAGLKYLIRATFLYGNYDGLNKLPTFDIYFGINYWKTISISTADAPVAAEVIAVIPDKQVQICLINTGLGTPFISVLELRPLKSVLYPAANATQAIVLQDRLNAGPTDTTLIRSVIYMDKYVLYPYGEVRPVVLLGFPSDSL
ncbi:probable LRR receptor-like serine/threonine-protein kinase At4g29180 [Typha latifolia]|uniref:probable LRR receptor-like serine/threonine-protein kinase At4g29180 n=1 Tax=Typha latifolia TaxID=4733 RepID=UPI003C2CF074